MSEHAESQAQTSALHEAGSRAAGVPPASCRPFLSSNLMLMAAACAGPLSIMIVGIEDGSLLATWLLSLLLLVAGTLLLLPEQANTGRSNEVLRLFYAAFGFRVAGAVACHFWLNAANGNPYWNWGAEGGDEKWFYNYAGSLATAWQAHDTAALRASWDSHWAYYAWLGPLACIRRLGSLLEGDTVFNVKLLSCFFSALVVPYVFRLALWCFELRTARVAALVAFLLPDFWFFGFCLLRDVAISCLTAMVLCEVVAGTREKLNLWRLAWAALLTFGVLLYLRPDLAFLLFGICCAWLVAERLSRPARLLKLVPLVLVVIPACLLVPYTREHIFTQLEWLFSPERVAYRTNINVGGGIEQAAAGSLGGAVLALPPAVRLPLLLGHSLLQFPTWAAINSYGCVPLALAGSLADTLWLGFVIFLPGGFLGCLTQSRRRTLWVWGTAAVLLLAFAYAAAIMPRWRLMAMPCLVILVAHGMLLRRFRKLALCSALAIGLLLAIYLHLKY